MKSKYPLASDFKGEIEFKEVYFEYLTDEPVLVNFDLHIKAGEKLAIVGHTGAGKSTISNIIARFYNILWQRHFLFFDRFIGFDI